MKRPSTLPIFVITGVLAGSILGWMLINIGISLDTSSTDGGSIAYILEEARTSPKDRLFFLSLIGMGMLLGACLAYSIVVGKKIASQRSIVEHAGDSDRAKNIFISMLLHFIRTPLAGIRWSLDSMRERGNLGVTEQHQVDTLYEETLRALDAVDHLLDVSRASVGSIAYDFSIVTTKDAMDIVDHACEEVRHQAEAKNIVIRVRHGAFSNRRIRMDSGKIQIAIETLLENALHYTPKSGSISIKTIEEKEGFRCAITDTGIGIPESDRNKIFMQFYRSENARRTRPGGFGVGLYMIKMFLEEHKGKIWYESRLNVGTTFFFELPFTEMPLQPRESRAQSFVMPASR